MPPKRDGNIATFFPPQEDTKGKSKAMDPTPSTPSDLPPPVPPKDEEKGKGKRPLSSSSLPTTTTKRPTKPTPSTPKTHFSPADLPPTWPSNPSPPSDTPTSTLSLTMNKGDLFTATPPHTLLIHACNTQGSWGAGIARAFRDRYPKAYAVYRAYCTRTYDPVSNPVPTGTALLIAPVDAGKTHWIGCLFTSAKYGRAKARPEVIVRDTRPAMEMLLGLVALAEGKGEGEVVEGVGDGEGKVEDGEKKEKEKEGIREVRMCRINAGLFAVPWEKTVEALESIQVREGWKGSVDVWEP